MRPPASAYSFAPIEGNLFPSASLAIDPKLGANSPSSVTITESTRLPTMAAKARSNLLGPCAWETSRFKFNALAADCIAGMTGLLTGLSGFDSAAGCAISGNASFSTSSRLAFNCGRKKVEPVTLASGLARLATSPVATASPLIAITMGISGDAVATGLVASLARPEANVTGSTFFLPQLNAKRLEVLKEALPDIAHPAALSNPDNPVSRPVIPAMQSAARALNLNLEVSQAQGPSKFDRAFAAMVGSRVDSVIVTEDGEFAPSFGSIARLALGNRLPSIGAKEYAEAGGLIGYGVNILGLYRRAAYFVDRILKGAKPADLPIEQPTKFELIVNLKTAKVLDR